MILVDFDESDDIYIFIIENNLKKIRKFLDPKLINLTIGITSVFSTLIPVIFDDIKIPT